MEDPYRVYAGVDWASATHRVWAADAAGALLGEREVLHGGEALMAMADWLVGVAGGDAGAVAVAIEVPHGPIVDLLVDRGCHVFAINPKQLDRFRDRFSPAGAKDDRRDARALSSALRTDRAALREVRVSDPRVVELRELSRQDTEVQEDLRRLVNRLREQLLRVWPELLRLSPAANDPWLWTLLDVAPTPSVGATLPLPRVRRILRQHRIRRLSAEDVAVVLRAPSVYVAPGVREGVAVRIHGLLEQLWVVARQRREAERRLEAALKTLREDTPTEKGREHADVMILQSLPGIGTRITAAMLADAAQPLQDRDYHALRVLGGAAPVTRRSGKSRVVRMRYACHSRVRVALRGWAMGAIQRDAASRAHYDQLRAKGHLHERALRGVADRLLAVLVAMLRDGTVYDEHRRTRRLVLA